MRVGSWILLEIARKNYVNREKSQTLILDAKVFDDFVDDQFSMGSSRKLLKQQGVYQLWKTTYVRKVK